MKTKFIAFAALAMIIAGASAIYAAGTGSDFYPADFSGNNMQYEKKMDVPMSTGNMVKVHIVKIRGQRMAVVPVDLLESLLSRAEGHSISLQ